MTPAARTGALDRLVDRLVRPDAFRLRPAPPGGWLNGWLHPQPRPRPVRRPRPYPDPEDLACLPPVAVEGTTPQEACTPAAVDDTPEDAYLLAAPGGVGWRHAWSCAVFGLPATISPGWPTAFLSLPTEQVRITQTVAVIPAAVRNTRLQTQAGLLGAVARLEADEGMDEDGQAMAAYRDVKRVQDEIIHHEAQVFGVTTTVTLVGTEAEVEEARKQLTEWLDTRDCEWRDLRGRHDLAFVQSTLAGGVANIAHDRRRNTTAMAYSWLAVGNTVDMGTGPYWGVGYGDAAGQRIHYDVFNRAAGGPEAPSIVFCGPNGSGKTTLTAHLSSEYLQYPPHRRPWLRFLDPKGDYRILVPAMDGITLVMSDEPDHAMNVMDLPPPVSIPGAKSNPVLEAVRTVTGFVVLTAARGGAVVDPRSRGVLDQAILATYAKRGIHRSDESSWAKRPDEMPLLAELEETLREPRYGETGKTLADWLSLYASGSLAGLFNRHTTVDLHHPFLCFDVEGLDEHLRAMVSYLIAATEWQHARRHRRPRIYLTDEVTQVLGYRESARLYGDIASMGRHHGVSLWTNGQLPTNWLNPANEGEGAKVWENALTKVFMKQQPGESAELLARLHHLTAWERDFLERDARQGDFLLLTPRGRVQAHCDPTDCLLSLLPAPATIEADPESEAPAGPRLAPVAPIGVGA
jgi:hypothetical protein